MTVLHSLNSKGDPAALCTWPAAGLDRVHMHVHSLHSWARPSTTNDAR